MKILLGRQVVLQALTLASGVVLARVLEPAQFGLYGIATFLVGAFALFGDFGLAASLIQRRDSLSAHALSVGFTMQQLVTTIVVAVVLAAAPLLAAMYPKAPKETVWLVRVLAFNLYLTSWRTISALQLERELRYRGLAAVEIVESISYQAIAVTLALAHFGVWSFVWATLFRGLLGTIVLYFLAPWKIRLSFDRQLASEILRFGIPFQLQGLANQAASWVTPVFVGSLIGPQAVGLLTWASSIGKKPLMLVESAMRVAFPHLSRLQDDRPELERVLVRYLTYLLIPSALWFVALASAGRPLLHFVYTAKWDLAIPAVILSAAALGSDVMGWIVGVALNSIGRAGYTAKSCLIRSVLQVLISIPLVLYVGINGVPIAVLVASISIVPMLTRGLGSGAIHRVLRPLIWVLVPLSCGLVTGLVARTWIGETPILALALVGLVSTVFLATAWFAAPSWILDKFRTSASVFRAAT